MSGENQARLPSWTRKAPSPNVMASPSSREGTTPVSVQSVQSRVDHRPSRVQNRADPVVADEQRRGGTVDEVGHEWAGPLGAVCGGPDLFERQLASRVELEATVRYRATDVRDEACRPRLRCMPGRRSMATGFEWFLRVS